jgi:predicted permease
VWRVESGGRYDNDKHRTAFFERLVLAAEAVPGVEAAGLTDALPLSRDRSWGVGARGAIYAPGEAPDAHPRMVDWRYIHTMRIPLLAGRGFGPQDTAESEKVIIINEKAARRLWPGANAVGQMMRAGGDDMWRVVGVVGNVRHQALEQEGGLEMYLPITQQSANSIELVVRTRLAPEALASGVRAALRAVDPTLPTAEFHALGELVDKAVSPRRFIMLLLAGFAAGALILACIGIYGVISYNVSQRTPEIGVRMALGASAGDIQRQILKQTLVLVGCGTVIGVAGALVLGRFAASMLFGVRPRDPATFAVTVLALAGVAILAGYGPAARAARVDPMVALRAE